MKVEIAFDLAVNGVGDWFTLSDPVMGVLGGTATTNPLSGDVVVDVTDDVRAVSVRRGRSRVLEKFTAGNATVTLDNRDRAYDPTNVDSPYYGSIIPRKEVRISVDDVNLFVGNVEDWNYSYALTGDSVAEPSCIDALAWIANQTLPAGTATSQLTGARASAVLDLVGWSPAARSLSTGASMLDADVREDDVNALAYLQQALDISEPGAFFMSRDGQATFLDRTDLQDFSDSGVVFGGTGIPFMDIGVVYGTEEMVNQVSVTWTAGTVVAGTATATAGTAVQATYGVIDQTYATLLDTASDAQDLADWIITQYAQPRYRFDKLTVRLEALTSEQKAQVLDLDLGSVALVDWTPNNAGSAITQYVVIDGIEHQAVPAIHDVTFTLSQTQSAFILDNTLLGQLDDDHLGF